MLPAFTNRQQLQRRTRGQGTGSGSRRTRDHHPGMAAGSIAIRSRDACATRSEPCKQSKLQAASDSVGLAGPRPESAPDFGRHETGCPEPASAAAHAAVQWRHARLPVGRPHGIRASSEVSEAASHRKGFLSFSYLGGWPGKPRAVSPRPSE